ncbi:MAG TPA: uroporphyrinogen-III C-methyltransferase [Isosphaeraceae bacterium]|jgi:uroporphyrinogen III methyltransferase/synthase|nr:uroporphyrinogen-III C-methyltransferase [Isosphaeraceae bacterium]
MRTTGGIVYLVGAGPGDPGLLTRRGRELLGLAEVVVYDHLANPRLLDLAPAAAIRVFAGKRAGHCAMPQEEINTLLVEHANAGRLVVRLKGGDPFVFGRGAEEAEYLHAHGVPFQVVPGVTAGVGVTAYAGLPITHRDAASAVAFVTGHHDPDAKPPRLDWHALAHFPGTLVIYMGVSRLRSLCGVLIREGMPADRPAALVQAGTLARQRTVVGTLADLPDRVADQHLGPPALLVIGEVVDRRPALAWFERLPLFGQRIVVTRPAEDAEASAEILEALGAEVLLAPTVRIEPLADPTALDSALERLDSFDWLVFTSANGVRHFLTRLESIGRDMRALGSLKLAAIGPKTAEALAAFHLKADLVPDAYRSEDLAAALAGRVTGRRVLLARADRGRTLLREELEAIAHVEQVPVYHSADVEALAPELVERLSAGTVDWITLTSSAITERLHALLSEDASRHVGRSIRLASLSPVTSATAARLGWPIAAEASVYTWDGLVQAIIQVAKEPDVSEVSAQASRS